MKVALQTCGLNLGRDGRELQPHGTAAFPCAGYRAEYSDRAEDAIAWHWHEELELIHIHAGCAVVKIPGRMVRLEVGECLLINSNLLHYAVAEPWCEMWSLVFQPSLVAGEAQSVFARKYIHPLLGCKRFDAYGQEEIAKDFTSAFGAMEEEPAGYEWLVRERLSRICLSAWRRYRADLEATDAGEDVDSLRMRKMLAFIHKHYEQDIGLSQIAKAANIGQRECLRCFQRAIQAAPMQYVQKYRVMQAAAMLARNRVYSIADIAGACGFDSPSHFSFVFKRFFLCTPREYRQQNALQA